MKREFIKCDGWMDYGQMERGEDVDFTPHVINLNDVRCIALAYDAYAGKTAEELKALENELNGDAAVYEHAMADIIFRDGRRFHTFNYEYICYLLEKDTHTEEDFETWHAHYIKKRYELLTQYKLRGFVK